MIRVSGLVDMHHRGWQTELAPVRIGERLCRFSVAAIEEFPGRTKTDGIALAVPHDFQQHAKRLSGVRSGHGLQSLTCDEPVEGLLFRASWPTSPRSPASIAALPDVGHCSDCSVYTVARFWTRPSSMSMRLSCASAKNPTERLSGDGPLEWSGQRFVVPLEGQHPVRDGGQGVEVSLPSGVFFVRRTDGSGASPSVFQRTARVKCP